MLVSHNLFLTALSDIYNRYRALGIHVNVKIMTVLLKNI